MIGTREGSVYRLRGKLVDDESGGRSESVATVIAADVEDSCSSMRRPSWCKMTLEGEQESEQNSQFRMVWRTPLAVDPVQASEELSDPEEHHNILYTLKFFLHIGIFFQ